MYESVTDKVSRILDKHEQYRLRQSPDRGLCSLRRLLVYPARHSEIFEKSNCVHKIPSKRCERNVFWRMNKIERTSERN